MRLFWLIFYNIIIIPIMWIGFHLLALYRQKIRRGIKGRRNLFKNLNRNLKKVREKNPRIWIHNSSMGEYEQAKPLIQQLKSAFPDSFILVTFFSPSGLEHVRKGHGADILCYLPFDSFFNARRFVKLVRPDAAITIRHEFWPNFLYRVHRENIPSILVNASIRNIKWLRYPLAVSIMKYFLCYFDSILSVSQETLDIITQYRLYKGSTELAGDTRYDQVMQRAREAEPIVAPLRKIKGKRQCFVAGSTWPADEVILFPVLGRLKKEHYLPWIILAPHEPTDSHLNDAERSLEQQGLSVCRFSEIGQNKRHKCDVLLIDRIGILASLYALGEIAFVGGGFGAGVHQVLEPAALGRVVFYGPRNQNSYEANKLQKCEVGFVIENSETLYRLLSGFLRDPQRMKNLGRKAAELVKEKVGASQRIVTCLERLLSS